MSVINQMLNGLEQRGVQLATEQVRPVHAVRDTFRVKALAAVLIALIAGALWFRAAEIKPKAAPRNTVAAVVVPAPPEPVAEAALPEPVDMQNATLVADEEAVMALRLEKNLELQVPHPVARSEPAVQSSPLKRSVTLSRVAPVAVMPNTDVQPIKQISPQQQADAEYRKAVAVMKQGRGAEALAGFEAALRLDAGHEAARGAMAALLLEEKRGADAERVLQDGLKIKPNSGFAMLLARLQIQRDALDQAIATLEATLPHALRQPEYHAFYAALLQRKARHLDAAEQYQFALKAVPNSGVWWMGYGISLQALAQNVEAKLAFQRALECRNLSPELQLFVQQKSKAL